MNQSKNWVGNRLIARSWCSSNPFSDICWRARPSFMFPKAFGEISGSYIATVSFPLKFHSNVNSSIFLYSPDCCWSTILCASVSLEHITPLLLDWKVRRLSCESSRMLLNSLTHWWIVWMRDWRHTVLNQFSQTSLVGLLLTRRFAKVVHTGMWKQLCPASWLSIIIL